jgi:hypothetical protein
MDSSSTKLYAALALDLSSGLNQAKQDVLIYDGRVAGALGYITRRLCEAMALPEVPPKWRFPVERPYGKNKRRNPSSGNYKFPPFVYGDSREASFCHTERAFYARNVSRIIQLVLAKHAPSIDFVVAERSLFMIGYDVRTRCDGIAW